MVLLQHFLSAIVGFDLTEKEAEVHYEQKEIGEKEASSYIIFVEWKGLLWYSSIV